MHLGKTDFPLAHIAIAVENIAAAAPLYQSLGFVLAEPEVVASQQTRVQLVSKGELHIELLEAHPAGAGPIAKFIAKRGAGLHHIALRSTDLGSDLHALEATGVRALPGYPANGAAGTRVAFLDPKTTQGTLIELVM